MPLTILAAADLHLGRRPSRLPESLTEVIQARDLGPAGAWERLVDLALEEQVDAVLLAGDVVEAEDDFFEAFGELRKGVARLVEGGVRILAVAGNHDTKVLPYLADELEGFELLGRDGKWESRLLSGGGEEATIWGWSFSRSSARENPVGGQSFPDGSGPSLGLLHCDRDKIESPYAPVSSRALEEANLDAWLLGHIHSPDALSPSLSIGYLGSLTGLDPGEPGPRGPWMLTVDRGTITEIEQKAIAPLRWISQEVNLDGLEEPEEARGCVLDLLRELDEVIRDEPLPPLAVGVRLIFTGHTRFRQDLEALFDQEELDDVLVSEGPVHYFVETIRVNTLPEINLEELAGQDDPAGLLARRLLLLERPPNDPDLQSFISRTHHRLERTTQESTWRGLGRDPSSPAETAEALRRAGRLALDLLLSGREDQ